MSDARTAAIAIGSDPRVMDSEDIRVAYEDRSAEARRAAREAIVKDVLDALLAADLDGIPLVAQLAQIRADERGWKGRHGEELVLRFRVREERRDG